MLLRQGQRRATQLHVAERSHGGRIRDEDCQPRTRLHAADEAALG